MKIIHWFIHPSIHSFIRSFLSFFLPSFLPSFIHSFLPSFLHSFIHPFLHSFIHSFLPSFFSSFLPWFIHSNQLLLHFRSSWVQTRRSFTSPPGTSSTTEEPRPRRATSPSWGTWTTRNRGLRARGTSTSQTGWSIPSPTTSSQSHPITSKRAKTWYIVLHHHSPDLWAGLA